MQFWNSPAGHLRLGERGEFRHLSHFEITFFGTARLGVLRYLLSFCFQSLFPSSQNRVPKPSTTLDLHYFYT